MTSTTTNKCDAIATRLSDADLDALVAAERKALELQNERALLVRLLAAKRPDVERIERSKARLAKLAS
jgi:hypothetical protein